MYKSKVILSSLTVLGLAGAGVLGSNYINLVNAESDVNQKVETIASQVDKYKSKDNFSNKSNVYAEELKSEDVYKQLIDNAISESDNITNDKVDVDSEDVVDADIVESEHVNESIDLVSEENKLDVVENQYDTESNIENKIDEVILETTESVVEGETSKLEDTTVNEVVDTDTKIEDVHEEPKVEDHKDEASVVETPVVEEKHDEVKSDETLTEDVKPSETPIEVKDDSNVEPIVEQPKEEPVVEETKVETPDVVEEVEETKPVLINPINDKTNTYPIGQCTWGVKSLADWVGNYWGNANEWGASARKAGYQTGTVPQVGSVIVFPNSIYEGVNYGHVAYVTNVYDDGTIEVLESNYNGDMQIKNYRGRFNPNQPRYGGVYYIYPNA